MAWSRAGRKGPFSYELDTENLLREARADLRLIGITTCRLHQETHSSVSRINQPLDASWTSAISTPCRANFHATRRYDVRSLPFDSSSRYLTSVERAMSDTGLPQLDSDAWNILTSDSVILHISLATLLSFKICPAAGHRPMYTSCRQYMG